MDRIHFEDLTKITAPFGLLDDDTQARLKAWPHGWEILSVYAQWVKLAPVFWNNTNTYRAVPAPLEKPSVDWSQVGPAVNYIALDEDGEASGFEEKPALGKDEWRHVAGRLIYAVDRLFPSYRRGTVPWDQILISRPGVEE